MQKLLQMNCPEVEIIATSTNVDEAIEKIRTLKPVLVFLDNRNASKKMGSIC
jgi:response regulator of citrate/malate metabolism